MTAAGTAMKEAYKSHGLLKSEAKRLKGWLEQEFEESKKYSNFVDSIYKPDENEKELIKWLNDLDEEACEL
jgi:hypothetical protein